MAGPTRWGILGAGKISHDFVNALKMMPDEDHQVAAIAARSLNGATEFNQMFGKSIPKMYGSYKELAQDPDIDIVYIGTIHPFHYDTAVMMMSEGKHVLVEKPMGMNAREVKQLTNLAKEKNVFLMEGFWSRCFPIYNHLREELAAGSIGDVHTVIVNFGVPLISWGRVWERKVGAGAILDVGCYPVMVATLVFGERPERICASGVLSQDEGVDVCSSTTLYYKGNRRAHLNVAADHLYDNVATIFGTKGSIKIPNFWNPEQMITPSKTYECPVPRATLRPMNLDRSEGFTYEAACIRECLHKGHIECPLMTHEHSLIISEITDEMRKQIGVIYDADERK